MKSSSLQISRPRAIHHVAGSSYLLQAPSVDSVGTQNIKRTDNWELIAEAIVSITHYFLSIFVALERLRMILAF